MRLVKNIGNDRVLDVLNESLTPDAAFAVATPALNLFAFAELRRRLQAVASGQIILPNNHGIEALLGSAHDRARRNRLDQHWLAAECTELLQSSFEVRTSRGAIAQSMMVVGTPGAPGPVLTGSCAFTTEGLGIAPTTELSLVQHYSDPDTCTALQQHFAAQWNSLAVGTAKATLLAQLEQLSRRRAPAEIYLGILYQLFKDLGVELDQERIINSATGIRETAVWKKLYKFQRDGVIGAIDKLERYGGCIIADSVGLGKTFEALAVIKYHELRNNRVLVLAPKRLRDNWTVYRSNDRRNPLAADRFSFDVLNHTDLSRDTGMSGDINLASIHWGNYDLVVIDESHNFRNKKTPRQDQETRYDRLMRRIVKEGVRTRVLMLSATPVNNRLTDLRNQISFATAGNDAALVEHGIPSIDGTIRLASAQFRKWLALGDDLRRPAQLMEMLGFDYFKLLDLVTIARSRKHIEKYYGISETGRFPERLRPINLSPAVDRVGAFQSIREINDEIRRLNLAAYAPLRYVLPHRRAAYDAKYNTQVKGGSVFKQTDRENSLVHLLRVNALKRMESSVSSFALTLQRQLADVVATINKIDSHSPEVECPELDDLDIDDPATEALMVGRGVKVLLGDVDLVRWRQDLNEDCERLTELAAAAAVIDAARDAKLDALRTAIETKCAAPINPGNRKVIVFTAFADTARYLYEQLAGWAKTTLGLETALVTGTGRNQTTLPDVPLDLANLLTAFSPRSKERAAEFADEGELDLLIATDCISEGQNLQDCDTLINYDIHWNPVRIIQRFGRIDRLGSCNERIQLINFWPNIELEEYIGLEQRVAGRMMLLDISATGEENVIEHQTGNQMNDLEYRRRQLLKLQDTVIDLEDLSNGVSIADLTLNDLRVDLANRLATQPSTIDELPPGAFAVVPAASNDAASDDGGLRAGIVFCLRAVGDQAASPLIAGYPLAPHYLVHVGDDGEVLLPVTQAKAILDRLKRVCDGNEQPLPVADAFAKATRDGANMSGPQALLAKAIAAITGKKEERAVASLFSPGGTVALASDMAGNQDFEVVAFVVVQA
ncbi:MAG TPA: helicase-related protein [Kofleriaceae bacterium]|nr:helicase-related protein [Kofleriaceae bacterium]